jgi:hypothetical protein
MQIRLEFKRREYDKIETVVDNRQQPHAIQSGHPQEEATQMAK